MGPSLTRRTLLGSAAALPFLRIPTAAARTPGLLTFGLSSYPPTIQPWANSGTAAGTVKLMIYRGLLSFDHEGRLRPELAEKWAADGQTAWVFSLRDAVFQNGDKVTSADVKWTLEQIAAEKSTAYFRAEFQGVDRIETPDDKTVRIVMKQPTVTLPQWLASPHLPIISRRSTEGGGQPVGAGPFVLKAQERGVSLDLVAFDKFYRPGLPKLKAIRVVVYADENLRVSALHAGDVDLIEYVPWQAMEAITADPKLKLDAVDGPFMYLVFNGSKPPFNDARVRRAVAHAVKRDEIVRAAFFGRGAALEHLPISDASEFFNPDLRNGWRYDPDLAKRLLAEAGLAGGISCKLLSTAQYGMHKDTAEIVQQNLAAIGIQAELVLPDWASRVQLGNRGQFEIAVMGTASDSNDPDGLSSLLDGSLSPSYARSFQLRSPRIEDLLKAGRAEFDTAKRKATYAELERIAIEEAPIVGLAWRSQGYAMAKEVTGFKNLPGALSFISGLTFEDTALG
jgi:peptide/nickel transport system substrate-binding protein